MKTTYQRPITASRAVPCTSVTSILAGLALFTAVPHASGQTAWSNALSCDGVNDYVRATIPALANDYTVSAWVYLRAGGNWSGNRVGVLSAPACGGSAEVLIHSWTESYTGPQYLELGRCGALQGTASTNTMPVPLNQWVHVAVTVSSQKQVSYFINGVAAGTWTATANLTIGPNITLGDNNVRRFNGMLDDVRIWSTTRSQAEILADMSCPITGSEPHLVAYWRFDESSGTVAADATTSHCDAQFSGNPVWTQSTIPPFMKMETSLPAATHSSVAWADFNNDGRLDILLTGQRASDRVRIAQIWQSTDSGFVLSSSSLPGVWYSSVACGDYNNDGLMDILIAGAKGEYPNYNQVTEVWRNTGTGFVNINAGLPGAWSASVAWGDYDNDGRPDILLTGISAGGRIAQIWRNLGETFTNVTATVAPGLPGVEAGAVAWGDYDNDGRLDVLLTGYSSAGTVSQLWRNTSNGFTNVTTTIALGLRGVNQGAAAWGDYDNDGWLDILLTGNYAATQIAEVWRNTGAGFTNINAGLPGVRYTKSGSAAWGDYNNDGRLDILLTGEGSAGRISQVFQNTGQGFTPFEIGLPGVEESSVAWGDYDNDGRLDILLTGDGSASDVTQLWRNNQSVANTPPTVPTGLTSTEATLSWSPATDAQTPSGGLTYNLRVGTNSGGYDIVSPQAELATGFRRLPALGNVQCRLNGLGDLSWGVYYWSVQAVDTAFAGSPFSPEQRLVVAVKSLPATDVGRTTATLNAIVNPLGRGTRAWFEWGDSTNYGRSTPILLQETDSTPHPVSCTLTGLVLHAYHYRIVATNDLGVLAGFDSLINLRLDRPQVGAVPPADLSPTSATLHGTVNPMERETLAWFEYGLTTKYGTATPAAAFAGVPDSLPLANTISNLLPWMTYHYRLLASNSVGLTIGSDQTLSLPGPQDLAPSLSTLADISITQGAVTSVWFNVSDLDTPASQLSVQVRANNLLLFPDGSVVLDGSGTTRGLTLTPDPGYSGTTVITVRVSDDATTTSRSFAVTVTPSAEYHSALLYLTNARPAAAQAWRFHIVDAGTGATNYMVEYRLDMSPTNDWMAATNVTDLGGGVFEVETGPPQPGVGFYRVKGFRLLTAGLGAEEVTADEGTTLAGPVILFDSPFVGTLNYTWTGVSGSTNGTVQVNGTTVVIPIPVTDNSGIDQLRSLTLRLQEGQGYAVAAGSESTVTVTENDAEWQGVLAVPSGIAGTTTASLTNSSSGGYTSVSLPQNTDTIISFALGIRQSHGSFQGQIHSDGAGFFPTNALVQMTLTDHSFSAVATNIPLPALTGSLLFNMTHYLDLRLDAANASGQTNVSPTRVSGVATLVSVVPGRPYLDSAVSGTFVLIRPPVTPSTNEVSLTNAR